MPSISEDFPDPDTPATATKIPRGISQFILFRLLKFAPCILIFLPEGKRRFSGMLIRSSPDRNCPVTDSGASIIFLNEPCAVMCPPSCPATGPMSTK